MQSPSSNLPRGPSLATNVTTPGVHKSTLFLGDLSTFCTEKDIQRVFSPFGKIVEIKIMRSDETQRNLCFGFVKFASIQEAQKALNGLNGVLFCGRNLRLGWACYKNKKSEKLPQHHDRIESCAVHVSFISHNLRRIVTEESLRILFSSFGVVVDTAIKKTYIDENSSRQCGYGFVHFSYSVEGIESALAAVASINDKTVDGVSFKCCPSHNMEKQMFELRAQGLNIRDPFAPSFSPHVKEFAVPPFAQERDGRHMHHLPAPVPPPVLMKHPYIQSSHAAQPSYGQSFNAHPSQKPSFSRSIGRDQYFDSHPALQSQQRASPQVHNDYLSSMFETNTNTLGGFLDDFIGLDSRSDSLSDSSVPLSFSSPPTMPTHHNHPALSFSQNLLSEPWF